MKDSIHKSIAEIMTFFDFEKVAEIEESFFKKTVDNKDDKLIDVIKEYTLDTLYEFAEESVNKKVDCWREGKYNLRFDYVYDKNEPWMELKYVPVLWDKR
jgi:hypothetical protein